MNEKIKELEDMKWQDTVLDYDRSKASPLVQGFLDAMLKDQAEASFKAGMREVVEWVEKHKKQRVPNYQKEEWGL